jgi:hypothetical protein
LEVIHLWLVKSVVPKSVACEMDTNMELELQVSHRRDHPFSRIGQRPVARSRVGQIDE